MFKTVSILMSLILLFSTVCYGGEITLRKSFWWGYFYTKDGVERKVGGGKSLKMDMAGVKEAQEEIGGYRTKRIVGTLFVLVSIPTAAVGYAMYIDREDFDWDDIPIGLIGGVLAMNLVGFSLRYSASSHLKKGVSIYNQSLRKEQTTAQRLSFIMASRNGGLNFRIKYDF